MKIGILAAMRKELELLRPLLQECEERDIEGRQAWFGKVGNSEVCLMQCGIGKVNSALMSRRLIEAFEPDLIINSGVAGGADPSMKIGTLLVATGAAYHDAWCGPGTEYGAADGFPPILECDRRLVERAETLLTGHGVREGLICSGDKFITTAEEIAEIKNHFPEALACDMESASIGQTCSEAGIPFAILRVVSDTPGQGENISQYENFWVEAPMKTFEAVGTLLHSLGNEDD